MIKTIIHLSDIHIRTTQYHDIYQKQFDKVYEVLDSKNLNYDEVRVVITGDVFHQKINISNEQLVLASNLFTKLSQYGKLVIIPGNHDFLENNTQRLDSITPIVELLNSNKIVYYKNGGVYADENVNWVVYSLYEHNKKPDFLKNEDRKYIGLFHGPIQGLSTDVGYQFDDGYDRINFVDCDFVLCGDIHKRQTFTNDKTTAVMIGSLLQQNFGESIKHHGFGIYHVDTNTYEFCDIENESPFMHFEISDIKDIEDDKEILLNLG